MLEVDLFLPGQDIIQQGTGGEFVVGTLQKSWHSAEAKEFKRKWMSIRGLQCHRSNGL